jgi:predicted DNA-binding transcriptional regulator YafY
MITLRVLIFLPSAYKSNRALLALIHAKLSAKTCTKVGFAKYRNLHMYHPTTRVLAVLELLQTHGRMSGAEIAERLEVDVRTARRYIEMLQDLGIPVAAERGRYGAYSLGQGYKLPPMMFTDDEATALTLGLLAARRLGLADAAPAVESALAKVERVMPGALRGRVRSLADTIALDLRQPNIAPPSEVMRALSLAAQGQHRVRMRYQSAENEVTERDFDPYGLAFRSQRWYVSGYCHLRRGLRSFRLDRVLEVTPSEMHFERPARFDVMAHLADSMKQMPRKHAVEVFIYAPLEQVELQLPEDAFLLEPQADGVLMRGRTDDLTWLAQHLSRMSYTFEIRQPDDLRTALREHAQRLLAMAETRLAPA